MELVNEAYVARQSLKTARVWRPSEADCESLASSSVWRPSESEVHQSLKPRNCSLFFWRHIIAEGIEAWSNDYFRGIRMHWMLIHWKAQEKDVVQLYNHYSTTPLSMSAIVLLQLCLRWLFSKQGMNFKLFPLRTLTKSSNRSLVMIKLQQRLFWCAGNPQRISHTFI